MGNTPSGKQGDVGKLSTIAAINCLRWGAKVPVMACEFQWLFGKRVVRSAF